MRVWPGKATLKLRFEVGRAWWEGCDAAQHTGGHKCFREAGSLDAGSCGAREERAGPRSQELRLPAGRKFVCRGCSSSPTSRPHSPSSLRLSTVSANLQSGGSTIGKRSHKLAHIVE